MPLLLPPRLFRLAGDKVMLRTFTAQDINDDYLGWLNDAATVRFSNQRFRKHTIASCEQYLASFDGSDNLFAALCDRDNGRLVGTMTAYVSRHHGTADMGLMIGERAIWGQGYGQDAWNTLGAWLLGPQVGIRKLTGGTARPNAGMLRIMERFGMQLEAVRPAQEIIEGQAVDLLYYGIFGKHV